MKEVYIRLKTTKIKC